MRCLALAVNFVARQGGGRLAVQGFDDDPVGHALVLHEIDDLLGVFGLLGRTVAAFGGVVRLAVAGAGQDGRHQI